MCASKLSGKGATHIVPPTATPTVWPKALNKAKLVTAWAWSSFEADACTVIAMALKSTPVPTPGTRLMKIQAGVEVSTFNRSIKPMPNVVTAHPPHVNHVYFPVMAITIPATTLAGATVKV